MTFGVFNGPGRPWTLGRIAGIPIRLQPLLVLLVGAVALFQSATHGLEHGVVVLVGLGLVAASVLLHELGHAIVAQRLGVGVVDITLWPLGGVAMLRGMPEDPAVEGAVALAGPLVNFVLVALSALGMQVLGLLNQATELSPSTTLGAHSILALILWVNLVMGVFNLLPAFPMDGGKILRSLVARKRGWLRGTEVAASVGRLFAWAMILLGWQWSPMMPFLGFFLLYAGGKELLGVRLRHSPAGPFGAFRTFGFGGARGAAGGIDLEELIRRAAQAGGAAPGGPGASSDPASDPPIEVQRPTGAGGGFSDDDIRRMESSHGRLKRD